MASNPSANNRSAPTRSADLLSPLGVPSGFRNPINLRSVLLGTGLSALIAGLSPYNDFVVGNGFLIACYLPVGFVFCMFALVVGVNLPLRRWAPGRALSAGELAVVTLMALAACSIPCQGLLRSFLPTLVHPFSPAVEQPFWKAFSSLGLPRWLYPVGDIANGRSSDVVKWFYARVPEGKAIPYSAWVGPLAIWGIFFACLFATLISSATLIFPQWAGNERLPFPIAQVELALISEPERGRLLGALFRSRGFWVAAIVVFLLHSLEMLHGYFPKRVPEIPLTYSFLNVMTGEPWRFLPHYIKTNTIYFMFVGMAYFIQARVGFSIWATFLIIQVIRLVQQTQFQNDTPLEATQDQHLGACVIFIAGVFWVGRHYWKTVFAGAMGKYRTPLLVLVLGLVGMIAWLKIVGVSLPMAMLIVGFVLLAHLVAARVVAETGLPIFRCYAVPGQIFMRTSPLHYSGRDVYFAQVFTANGAYNTRESALAFVQHGLWIVQGATGDSANTGAAPSFVTGTQRIKGLGWLIAWAMAVSFVVGSWSSLHAYYTHTTPLTDRLPARKINPYGVDTLQVKVIATPLAQFSRGRFPASPYRPGVHVGIGAGVALILSILALRYSAWPFLPVGYVIATTNFSEWFWYSVALGWLAKVLVLRFGGARLFQAAKPFFIGLIVGEAIAAGAWLAINLVLAALHYDYQPVLFYPS